MSLMRRNITAWVLLALAALGWVLGLRSMEQEQQERITGTLVATVMNTTAPTIDPVGFSVYPESTYSMAPTSDQPAARTGGSRWLGLFLCFAGIAAAVAGILFLWQKQAVLGPDAAAVLLGLMVMYYQNLSYDYTVELPARIAVSFLLLLAVRELWGWLCCKIPLSWCTVRRLAERCKKPQLSLLVYILWCVAAAVVCCWIVFARAAAAFAVLLTCVAAAGVLGICCLWQFGTDMEHFRRQLDNFRDGSPIAVKPGSFAPDEEQLLQVQAQHAEAVQTAVTSERFKVELIANVSHDLRTPLTSILGYSELLKKESLSPEGQEQLCRLHQKAGYMNDLVESLFELTKVSSGVNESKKEKIDLIRLLEQTLGLFDDQLTGAQLVVRRHYEHDAMPVVTDGARMHQVFANLVGNAIKYALPGTRLHLHVWEKPETLCVRLVNTAAYEMDFTPEEILQRFTRGDKARSTKGSGLGLAIAQTYTESVGGGFRVEIDGDQFSAIVELPKTEREL